MFVKLKQAFRMDNIFIDGDIGYFISAVFGEGGRIFSVDFKTNELKFINKFPKGANFYRAYPYCIKHNNFIYCLPAKKENILRYNLENKSYDFFATDDILTKQPDIIYAWKTDKAINAFFMAEKGVLLQLDLKNNMQKVLCSSEGAIRCSFDIVVDSAKMNICYTALEKEPKIFKWDMERMIIETYIVPNMNEGIGSIALLNNIFFITGYDSGDVYKWEWGRDNSLKIKNEWNIKGKNNIPIFGQSRILNGKLFLFSTCDEYIYYISVNDSKLERIAVPKLTEFVKNNCVNYSFYKPQYDFQYTRDNNIGIYSYRDFFIYEFNTITFEFKKIEYKIERDNWEIAKQSLRFDVIREGDDFAEEVFWYLISNNQNKNKDYSTKKVGEKILSLINVHEELQHGTY